MGHNLSLMCQMTSEDIKHQLIISGRKAKCLLTFPVTWVQTSRPDTKAAVRATQAF